MVQQDFHNLPNNLTNSNDSGRIAGQNIAGLEFSGESRFSPQRLAVLSEISRDIAQVFFASMVVGVLLTGKDVMVFVSLGIIASGIFWFLAIRLVK